LYLAELLCVEVRQAQAQGVIDTSLSSLLSQRANWDDDVSEVAYVAARCGALFIAIGGYFLNNGVSQQNKETANDMLTRATVFNESSIALSGLANMTVEDTIKRGIDINRAYNETMARNKRLINNALHTPVADDLRFCAGHEQNFQKIAQLARRKAN
jgi:hypothetical protein